MVCATMMFSATLQQMEVREIGQYLLGSDLSPFLNPGVTKAFLQSDGIVSVSNDCWIMKVNILAKILQHMSSRILLGYYQDHWLYAGVRYRGFMDNSPTNQLADSQLADRRTRRQSNSPTNKLAEIDMMTFRLTPKCNGNYDSSALSL